MRAYIYEDKVHYSPKHSLSQISKYVWTLFPYKHMRVHFTLNDDVDDLDDVDEYDDVDD